MVDIDKFIFAVSKRLKLSWQPHELVSRELLWTFVKVFLIFIIHRYPL